MCGLDGVDLVCIYWVEVLVVLRSGLKPDVFGRYQENGILVHNQICFKLEDGDLRTVHGFG